MLTIFFIILKIFSLTSISWLWIILLLILDFGVFITTKDQIENLELRIEELENKIKNLNNKENI